MNDKYDNYYLEVSLNFFFFEKKKMTYWFSFAKKVSLIFKLLHNNKKKSGLEK